MSYRIPLRFTEIEAAQRLLQKEYDETMKMLNPSWWDILTGQKVIPLTDERKMLQARLDTITDALVSLDEKLMDQVRLVKNSVDVDYTGPAV